MPSSPLDLPDMEILQTDPDIDVRFELHDGSVIDYDTFQESYDELNERSALSGCLRISAWTTPIRVLGYDPPDSKRLETGFGGLKPRLNGCQARIDLEDGGYLHWDFEQMTKKRLSMIKNTLVSIWPTMIQNLIIFSKNWTRSHD